jgi:hypothetical protein
MDDRYRGAFDMQKRTDHPTLRELLDEGWPPSSLPDVDALAMRAIVDFATDSRPQEMRVASYRRMAAAVVDCRDRGWDDPSEVLHWAWVLELVEDAELCARFVAALEPDLRAKWEADRALAFAAMDIEKVFE